MCVVTEIEGNRMVCCVGSAFLLERSLRAKLQISSSQCDRDAAGLSLRERVDSKHRFNKTDAR